jgi:hypothetical protein
VCDSDRDLASPSAYNGASALVTVPLARASRGRAIAVTRPSTASASGIDINLKAHGMRLPCLFALRAGEAFIRIDTTDRWFLSV